MTIEQLIEHHVTNLVADIKEHLMDQFAGLAQRAKVRVGQNPRTDEQMRCKFSENGHRCKERSRGPRFHFLCAEHSKKPAKKPAKK
jgi:hypothetical protein